MLGLMVMAKKRRETDLMATRIIINDGKQMMWRLREEDAKLITAKDQCPECGGIILWGARGGLAQNCECESCHTRYNAHPFGVDKFLGA